MRAKVEGRKPAERQKEEDLATVRRKTQERGTLGRGVDNHQEWERLKDHTTTSGKITSNREDKELWHVTSVTMYPSPLGTLIFSLTRSQCIPLSLPSLPYTFLPLQVKVKGSYCVRIMM